MKSSVAVALAASFVPFVMASPYHMIKHAERDFQYEVEYVTDVQVATQYAEVTEYWTGEPAATETVTYSAPETTSVVETSPAPQTTESARARQHAEHTHQSSIVYTIEKTTTPEAAPTTTSTVAPAPAPTTTSTVAPAPESTTIPVFVAPTTVAIPTSVFTVASLPATTPSTSSETPAASAQSVAMGSADWIAIPSYAVAGYAATGDAAWDSDNMKAAVLQTHNAWRAKWGAAPLTWDDDQASQAQVAAQGCDYTHTRAGQNYASGTGAYTPTNAVNSWGEESVDWRDSNRVGGPAPNTTDSHGKIVTHDPGHFTQINWKATTVVGCAGYQCGEDSLGWFLVCNYDPVGNFDKSWENDYVDPTNTTRTGSWALNVNNAPVY